MENQESFFARATEYLPASVEELKKVSFPTRQEAIQATLVTTFIVMLLAVIISLMDLVFRQLMSAVLS